jgi:hypothetical protein
MLTRSPVPVAPRACAPAATAACTQRHQSLSHRNQTMARRTRNVSQEPCRPVPCAIGLPPDRPDNGGNVRHGAGQVCPTSASGITTARRYAKRRRGPSMYEMEGPRAASPTWPPIARPPRPAWRLPRRPGKPIAQMPCAAWPHWCQIPADWPGRPVRAAFPRFPLGRIPSSVVRDFYCQSSLQHKAFPQELQDSLAIHRTSVVYPLSMADFHCAMHRSVHSFWG